VSSATGLLFSYALGTIFVVGGILFMVLLDERRFLFGVPYLLIGLLLIGGVRATQRRRKAREAAEGDADAGPVPPSH
jgi:hypothetical protein